MPHARPSGWVRLANLLLLAVGVGALVWMAREVGLDQLADLLSSIRGWAIPLLLVSLAGVALDAGAIHVFMRPEQRMVSYWRVFAAQMSGQAINSVTPTGTLGEVVKATLLMGHAPRFRAVSSVIAFNLVNVVVSAVFVLLGIGVALWLPDLDPAMEHAMRIGVLLLAVVSIAVVALVRRGVVRAGAGAAHKLRFISDARRARIAERLEAFDHQLRALGRGGPASHRPGIGLILVSRLLGWFDLWLIMVALGHTAGLVFTVVAAAAGVVIGRLASIIPLGVGASEGGQAGLFHLLGAGAELGLAVSLVRRIRTVIMAAIGLLVMLLVQLIDQIRFSRAKSHLVDRTRDPGQAR